MTTTTAPTLRRETLFSRPFVLLILAELAYFTADGVAIYALPLYVTGPVGSGEAGAGLAFGAFAIAALALRPVAGRLADTAGRLPLLVTGAALSATGLLLTPLAHSLSAVVVLRVLLGVADAAFFVAAFAAVADLVPRSRMGEALSYNSLGLYLGLAFGPLLGEALATRWGLTAAWVGAALIAVVAIPFVVAVGETRPAGLAAAPRSALIHRRAIPIGLAFLAAVVAMGGFLALTPLHASAVGLSMVSLPLFAYGAVVIIVRIAFATLPDRHPPLLMGAISLVLIAAGLGVTALGGTAVAAVGGAVVMAIGVALCTPAFFSAIFATASESERGAASGTAAIFLDVGLGAGPFLLGVVAESAGIPWAFGVAAGVAVAGAAWSLHLHRTPR